LHHALAGLKTRFASGFLVLGVLTALQAAFLARDLSCFSFPNSILLSRFLNFFFRENCSPDRLGDPGDSPSHRIFFFWGIFAPFPANIPVFFSLSFPVRAYCDCHVSFFFRCRSEIEGAK